jgi:hypothetical protein
LASRGQSLLRYCSLFREATTEPGREALRQQIVEATSSFRGQTEARRRVKAPPRKADAGPVAASPTVAAEPVSVVPQAARSAAVVSRALTRTIVQAPWPPPSPTAAATTSCRSSPELFVYSPPPLVCSPVSLHEGDVVVSGALPLGAFPPSLSPAFEPIVTPVTPPRASPLPASPLPATSPIPSPAAAPSAALLEGLIQEVRRLAAAAEDISASLRVLVGSLLLSFCVLRLTVLSPAGPACRGEQGGERGVLVGGFAGPWACL